ncbi:MAG: hypothetical protein AAGB29_12090 [Planctomycetota bacterium]
MARDPIENDPRIKALVDAAMAEAHQIVEAHWESNGYNARGIRKGKTPATWKEAARILREKHGIIWKNPMQMTPGLFVD